VDFHYCCARCTGKRKESSSREAGKRQGKDGNPKVGHGTFGHSGGNMQAVIMSYAVSEELLRGKQANLLVRRCAGS
jgi:hypothetical protein